MAPSMIVRVRETRRRIATFLVDADQLRACRREALAKALWNERCSTEVLLGLAQAADGLMVGTGSAVKLLDATLHIREARRRPLVVLLSAPQLRATARPLLFSSCSSLLRDACHLHRRAQSRRVVFQSFQSFQSRQQVFMRGAGGLQ
jgi:hypothetical protein